MWKYSAAQWDPTRSSNLCLADFGPWAVRTSKVHALIMPPAYALIMPPACASDVSARELRHHNDKQVEKGRKNKEFSLDRRHALTPSVCHMADDETKIISRRSFWRIWTSVRISLSSTVDAAGLLYVSLLVAQWQPVIKTRCGTHCGTLTMHRLKTGSTIKKTRYLPTPWFKLNR